MSESEPHNLSGILERIDTECGTKARVSVEDVLEIIGRRSFGPLLVFVGAIMSAPLVGDIPGVPTVLGSLIVLTGLQLIVGRTYIWIPQFILTREIAGKTLSRTIAWMQKPARVIDRLIKPRLRYFTGRIAWYVILLLAVLISFVTPAMELVPFSANVAGAIFLVFGLSLIAKDGLLALIGLAGTLFLGGLLLSVAL